MGFLNCALLSTNSLIFFKYPQRCNKLLTDLKPSSLLPKGLTNFLVSIQMSIVWLGIKYWKLEDTKNKVILLILLFSKVCSTGRYIFVIKWRNPINSWQLLNGKWIELNSTSVMNSRNIWLWQIGIQSYFLPPDPDTVVLQYVLTTSCYFAIVVS